VLGKWNILFAFPDYYAPAEALHEWLGTKTTFAAIRTASFTVSDGAGNQRVAL